MWYKFHFGDLDQAVSDTDNKVVYGERDIFRERES